MRLVLASSLILLAAGFVPVPVPNAVVAWPAGPLEVRVAFDQPIETSLPGVMVGKAIPFREVGKAPQTPPLGRLRIAAGRLEDGGRTLVLATDPHPREALYELNLPGQAQTLTYSLNGVEATWDDGKDGSAPAWVGWWPGLDTIELAALAQASAEHAKALAWLAKPGRLTLRTLVTLPKGKPTILLASNAPIDEAVFGTETGSSTEKNGEHHATLTSESTGEAMELSLKLTTGAGGKPASLRIRYRMEADAREHPLPSARLLVPWAPASPASPPVPTKPPFTLAGGDPKRGEMVFFSEEAKCSSCHKVRGKGGEVGPALDEVAGRDPETIYRDIFDPSAVINPEYVAYTVALKDGQVAVGVVKAEGADAIRVIDTNAKATVLKKAEIEELRPSATSIMPVGLAGALGEQRVRDLIAFLTAKQTGPSGETKTAPLKGALKPP